MSFRQREKALATPIRAFSESHQRKCRQGKEKKRWPAPLELFLKVIIENDFCQRGGQEKKR